MILMSVICRPILVWFACADFFLIYSGYANWLWEKIEYRVKNKKWTGIGLQGGEQLDRVG